MTDPTISLRRWLQPLGRDLPPLYLVGGAVRDILLGRPCRDIDFICPDPEAFARRLGEVHQVAVVPFLKKVDAPCHRVVDRSDPRHFLDLSPIAGGSLTADLSRRDFTVNAMAMPVTAGGVLGSICDPLNGRRDLAARCIRVCRPDAFHADSLRILRALRFAAQLDFEVDEATLILARRHVGTLATLSVERVVQELFLLLQQPASASRIQTLDELGAVDPILPEIAMLKGCAQNAYHHLDVWRHSLAALQHLEALIADPAASFGDAARSVVTLLAADRRLPVLKLACLLHDLGKPGCRRVSPETGQVIFHGHEKTGAALAEEAARRLKLSGRDRNRLAALVGHHMQARSWLGPAVKPGTVLKGCRRLGDDFVLAILLGMADALAKRGPAADEDDRRRHLIRGREVLEDYFEKCVPALSARPLITGGDLLALGLVPGPRIGEILARVTAARDAGRITTREEALAMVRQMAGPGGPVS